MAARLVTLIVSPQAKSLVLQQLMATGLLNASIQESPEDSTTNSLDFNFKDNAGILQSTKTLRGQVLFINLEQL